MTRAEIISELRRSAREDECCYDCSYAAFDAVLAMRAPNQIIGDAADIKWRTFFLLVACALEDEC